MVLFWLIFGRVTEGEDFLYFLLESIGKKEERNQVTGLILENLAARESRIWILNTMN
jgi:hypothetical protein